MRNTNSLRAPLRGDVVLGSLWSWEGHIASHRASGGASRAWIGQDRKRKGLGPLGESQAGLRFQYPGRQMGKRPRQNFPKIKIQISDRRAPFFPHKVAESFAPPLIHPRNMDITT